MEAVPRLHMLWFALKSSPAGTSFVNLKKYIAEFYQEDPESYSKEVYALETLRNQAMHPTKDSCSILKRYYCQLHSLQNRFPQLTDRNIFTFTWKDLYQSQVSEVTDIRYELAAVLFNIAASHTQVGASVKRGDVDGMKLACTHFQCAAWSFGELRERYADINAGGDFMTTELLVFMQQVSFAQAQECILEKSLIDNRKPNIVAMVTAQIVVYYGAALAALLTGGDDGPIAQVVESSVYKLWKKYVRFKISYLSCILYLYQGQYAEEQQKMGERVTLYQAAWDKLEEARKESKSLPDQKEIVESLTFTADVVEAKRKNAKNENEFIYHEAVPELSTISAIQGHELVKGVSFSVTDPEVAGEDIFARLVPMKAHEASSMYSEEKAKLLRKYGATIEEKDTELTSFMSSLTLEHLNINEEKANKIPQGIVDRCAALNANKVAIPELITSMSQLADICADVEMNLKEIGAILAAEEHDEQAFQKATNVKRTPNAHIIELTREYQKYLEAHSRAGESNDTLRKAMELHVNNLKILARPLQEIQQSVPKLSSELNTNDIFKDVKLILNKVNEMKAQRSQFHADLRIAVNNDDITAKVIAHGSDEGLQHLFERELTKHERLTQLIDQNLLAQKNILQALTESYAKAAPILKTLADVKHKRENFFSSLAASYDVYEDLLAKSAKGLEFYKKLSGNVYKLLTRLKSARDVQAEERQQRLKTLPNNAAAHAAANVPTALHANINKEHLPSAATTATAAVGSTTPHSTPTLRDYLKAKNTSAASIIAGGGTITPPGSVVHTSNVSNTTVIPPIRPNPLGSETPSQAVCSGGYYGGGVSGGGGNLPTPQAKIGTSLAPNEPPPPYSLQQHQYFDPNAAGFTNPMFQQMQQNIAPPAYKPQASPNSQFTQNFGNMSLGSGFATTTAAGNILTTVGGSFQQQQQQQQFHRIAGGQLNQTATPPLTMQQQMFPQQQQQHQQVQQQQAFNQQLQPQHAMMVPPQQQNIPTTQPLYVVTSNNEATNAGVQAQPTPPPPMSLQAPFVVNQMQQTQMQYQQQQPVVNQQQQQQQQQFQQLQPTNMNQATQQAAQQQPHLMSQQALQQPTMALQQQQPQAIPLMGQQQQQQPQNQFVNQPPLYGQQQQQTSSDVIAAANSSIKHPGYSFNPQSGQYEYHSGYQQNKQFYGGQYTSATAMQQCATTGTTNSETANKTNLATGFDEAIISHAKSNAAAAAAATPVKGGGAAAGDGNVPLSYYTPPYGYQSHSVTVTSGSVQSGTLPPPTAQQSQQQTIIQQFQQQQQPQSQSQLGGVQALPSPNVYPQHPTYMQSGSASIASTQTTKSAAEYASSPTAQPFILGGVLKPTQTNNATNGAAAAVKPAPLRKPASNIDLLTDMDLSGGNVATGGSGVLTGVPPPPLLPEPVLKPVVVPSPPSSQAAAGGESSPSKKVEAAEPASSNEISSEPTTNVRISASPAAISQITTQTPTKQTTTSLPNESTTITPTPLRKVSYDNLSICSDLSSLDNFDFDSVSLTQNNAKHSTPASVTAATNAAYATTVAQSTFLLQPLDPFTDDKTLKYFHKEVERYEKLIESLNVKMLNGHTQLSAKWKELQDLLAKDTTTTKRTTTIAKLFPEKNRSLDCLPYDHARVKLEKNTDDYINAAYVKNLGAGCPNLIIAQTPQQNTINDFWSMIWTQKARTIVCLHTPNEMLDPYWPQEVDTETHLNDYAVKCVNVNALSHCTAYKLKLSMHNADPIIDLTLLQVKAWTKSLSTQVIGIATNALHTHQQRCLEFACPSSSLVMHCLTGSERSELLAIAICAILATQAKRPLLINVVDVWYRICCQRQNALRDLANLEQSMQIVLAHAHDVLNKRGIMTSYQMKIAPQVASKEKEDIKDPLNELDPLWKLK